MSRPMLRWSLLVAVFAIGALDRHAGAPVFAAPPRVVGDLLDERPAPLQTRQPRTEADEDRLAATALFAHGRLLLNREDYAGAIRRFQRAWRYDARLVSPLSDIVPLAAQLKQPEVMTRYAVLGAEQDPSDPGLLMRIAGLLAEQRDWRRALRLYELVQKALPEDARDFTYVMLQMERGRLYYLTEDYARAADAFAIVRDALAKPDQFGLTEPLQKLLLNKPELTYQLFAESFFEAERWDEALAMSRKVEQLRPNPGLTSYFQARIAAKRNRPEDALVGLDKYLDENLTEAGSEPYELIEQALLTKLGDPREARRRTRERLSAARKRFPGNLALTHAIAKLDEAEERWADVEAAYEAIVRQQPSIEAISGLCLAQQKRKKWDSLLSTLSRAASQGSPDQIESLIEPLANDETTVREMIARAGAPIKPAEKPANRPDTPEKPAPAEQGQAREGAPFVGALFAVEAKRFDDADRLYAQAVEQGVPSRPQVFLTWGLDLFLADQPARAARVFQRAIDEKVRPESNQTFYYYLSGALALDKQFDAALAAARATLAAGPKSPQMALRSPWILYYAKRRDEAEKAYRDFLKEYDSDFDTEGAREAVRDARLVLSNIAVLEQRMPEAEEWLEQILDEFPDHVGALNDLGYLWADQNKHLERSLRMCRTAVEAEPKNRAYRDSLGWALFRLGRFGEALDELKQAVDEEADGVVLEHLGDAHWALRQYDEARAAWTRAAKDLEADEEKLKLEQVRRKLAQATPATP